MFEAIVGGSWSSDIAIDDVFIIPGECQPPGGCDFENVSCVLMLKLTASHNKS